MTSGLGCALQKFKCTHQACAIVLSSNKNMQADSQLLYHLWACCFLIDLQQLSTRSFRGGASSKESTCQCKRYQRCGFNPWVRTISWSREWQQTPVLLPGKFHGQRSLAGYSPWGCTMDREWSEASQDMITSKELGYKSLSGHCSFLVMWKDCPRIKLKLPPLKFIMLACQFCWISS